MTRPGDALEREADRMADAALRATPDHAAGLATAAPPGAVMRQAADADDRRQPEYEEDEGYDVAAASRSASPPAAPAGFLEAVRATPSGRGLAEPLRGRMERGFGRPLDGVRIHDDAGAARLSDQIGARAFAHGRDVFFGAGEFRPGTDEGDRLVAHELAHTLQAAGAATIARQTPPKVDPSRLTDEEKIALRAQIQKEAAKALADRRAEFAKDPVVDAAARGAWVSRVETALASGEKIGDPRQKQARLGFLRAERRLMDDDFHAWLRTRDVLTLTGPTGADPLAFIGDPSETLSDALIAKLDAWTSVMGSGIDAYFIWLYQGQLYAERGIDPKDLRTEETSEAEGPEGVGAPPAGTGERSLEDRKVLEELNAALGDLTGEGAPVSDPDLLARELRKLTPEQRKDFYAFARRMVESSAEGAPKTLQELLDLFNRLDPASREALTLNREMAEQEPGREADALPESVLLDIKKDVASTRSAGDDARRIQSNLDRIRAVTQDPEAKKQLLDLDLGFAPFFDEVAMLQGLLAGGAQQSDLVRDVGRELITEIDEFQAKLQRELAELAAESLVLAGLTAATQGAASPALLVLLRRIQQVKKLIETLRRVYNVYTRVERVITIVRGAGDAYAKFRVWFEKATETYGALEAQLERLDSSEDIEEALEAQEERLLEELDTQLEGKLGELLEMMYIPEDTPPDELRRILFDIPRGITSLQEMWDHYNGGDSSSEHFAEVLAIKAFRAGRQLYPLVGLTAALIAEQLQAAFPERTVEDRINRLISRSQRGPGLRGRNRGLFGRLRPKNYDFAEADLRPHLTKAKTDLEKAIGDDEPGAGPGEHWAPAWFKAVVRREIKVVNAGFRGVKVPAMRKTKGPGGAVTKVREDVPLPPFRVRLKRPLLSRGKLEVVLKINPELTLEVDRLSNADFAGDGIEFAGTPEKRQEAIRAWLRDEGYQLTKDPAGNEHIRLPGRLEATAKRSYLHFAGGKIKAGIDKAGYRPFLGRVISDDRDLPEGYDAVELKGEATVSLKRGLARAGHQRLGLDQGHKLIEGAGTAPPRTVAAPGITKPTAVEGYDFKAPLGAMFGPKTAGGPDYNVQGKDRAWWTKLIDAQAELRVRPTAVAGRLGYVLRARAFGDALGSRHIPELHKQDDKGHLVAKRFGGVDDYGNLVPMLRRQNQFPGKWYDLESDMADVYVGKGAQAGHYVEFTVSFTYPSTKTRRPSRLVASYQEKDAADAKVGTAKSRTVDND